MRLEDYFDFISSDDIRIKGRRIGLDAVLRYYRDGYTAEEIAAQFDRLPLEIIYAAITYYLHHRAEVDGYLARLDTSHTESQREQDSQPLPAAAQRVRDLRRQRDEELSAA